jgi:hypothetical protein
MKRLYGPLVVILILAVEQGCAFREEKHPGGANALSLEQVERGMGYAEISRTILMPRCSRCHGGAGGVTLTDYSSVSAAAGRIQTQIQNRTMPPGAPLSGLESTALLAWIAAGLPIDPPNGTPGPPQPQPNPSPSPIPPLAPTYESIRANVFVAKCLSCHSPNSTHLSDDRPDLSTYEALLSSRVLRLERPEKSKLWKAVSWQDEREESLVSTDRMPPPGSGFPRVTPFELNVIWTWLIRGAPRN